MVNVTELIFVIHSTWKPQANCVSFKRKRGTLCVNVIFPTSASYCHVFFQTILHNKKTIKRIALPCTKKLTISRSNGALATNYYRKLFKGANDRPIIILTEETTKLSALIATSTQHVCIRRFLSHEVSCVGHKSKRKGRSPATFWGKQ